MMTVKRFVFSLVGGHAALLGNGGNNDTITRLRSLLLPHAGTTRC